MRDFLLLALILCGSFLNGKCGNRIEEVNEYDRIFSELTVANRGVYPFMMYFRQKDMYTGKSMFICTGTLIKPNKVLTSASCFEEIKSGAVVPSEYTPVAWLGTDILDGPTRVSRDVIAIVKHPRYNQLNDGNNRNIAIVTLETDVLPTIAIPAKLGFDLQPKIGVPNELMAIGWGYLRGISPKLRQSYMNLIADSQCQKVFGTVDNTNTICVAYDKVAACALDVGSAILSKDGKHIIGIIGKNMRCVAGQPFVALDIRRYYNWINNNLN